MSRIEHTIDGCLYSFADQGTADNYVPKLESRKGEWSALAGNVSTDFVSEALRGFPKPRQHSEPYEATGTAPGAAIALSDDLTVTVWAPGPRGRGYGSTVWCVDGAGKTYLVRVTKDKKTGIETYSKIQPPVTFKPGDKARTLYKRPLKKDQFDFIRMTVTSVEYRKAKDIAYARIYGVIDGRLHSFYTHELVHDND